MCMRPRDVEEPLRLVHLDVPLVVLLEALEELLPVDALCVVGGMRG